VSPVAKVHYQELAASTNREPLHGTVSGNNGKFKQVAGMIRGLVKLEAEGKVQAEDWQGPSRVW
jgi:hypothetical protein